MTEVERLREELERRAEVPPPGPGLADRAIAAAGRVRRRRRWGGAAVAVAAAVAVVAVTGLPGGAGRGNLPPAAPVTGPPRIPLLLGGEEQQVLRWQGPGSPQITSLASGIQVVGVVPDGLLVVVVGEQPALALVRDGDTEPRILLRGLADVAGVAVSADGRRAAVTVRPSDTGYQGLGVTLREVDLTSGRTLRDVPVGPPPAEPGEPVRPAAYAGDSVLLTVGEGDRQRAYRWEGGDGGVIGELTGYRNARGGTAGGLGAFDVTGDSRCRVEIAALRTGGRRWQLCREPFAGFSPDGSYVLATNAVGDGLVVRAARDGAPLRTFPAPRYLRGYGWESADTLLYSTLDPAGRSTLVIRCSVGSGRCATAASFPFTDRIPGPPPVYGPAPG